MKTLGTAGILGGGAAVVVGTLVSYDADSSLWDLRTRFPVILTVAAGAAVGLALAGLAMKRLASLLCALVVSAFLLGEAFPALLTAYDEFSIGFWLAVGGAALMTMASAVLVAGAVRSPAIGTGRIASFGVPAESVLGGAVPDESARGGAVPVGRPVTEGRAGVRLPPAGWYPDPSGTARERLWSGDAWTEHARS
jgi:hypothetical protein